LRRANKNEYVGSEKPPGGFLVMEIRPFEDADEDAVIALWERCGLLRSWNDPRKDIARKRRLQRELFLVGTADGAIIGTAMAGYDGHRGWINFLAVDPEYRRQGFGRALMERAERSLRALGCPKINLQVRRENRAAVAFYEGIGFREDTVLSFGKRLEQDD
jgi:ribosomal protein S18 acetylase RimI-like enzyme